MARLKQGRAAGSNATPSAQISQPGWAVWIRSLHCANTRTYISTKAAPPTPLSPKNHRFEIHRPWVCDAVSGIDHYKTVHNVLQSTVGKSPWQRRCCRFQRIRVKHAQVAVLALVTPKRLRIHLASLPGPSALKCKHGHRRC